MRKLANIWVPILLLGIFLTTVYFKQWFVTARTIRTSHTAQEADLALLESAKTAFQDLASLQMALRVKLFGAAAAEEALLSARPAAAAGGPLTSIPPSVLSAMRRNDIRLVYYKTGSGRDRGAEAEVQFEGKFENVVRFLDSTRADFPRTEGFLLERGAGGAVQLTLALSPKIS